MERKLLLAIAAVVVTVLGPMAVKADTVYNNILLPSIGSDAGDSAGPLYDSFSTGASPLTLTDVQLLLSGDSTSLASFSVSLFKDNGSTAPAAVALFTSTGLYDSSLNASATAVDFGPVSWSLDANTRYWIGLNGVGSSVLWYYSSDASGAGVSGEYFANFLGVSSNDNGPYQMLLTGNPVSVSATPLPAALPLFASGLGAIGLLGRRKKRKAATAT